MTPPELLLFNALAAGGVLDVAGEILEPEISLMSVQAALKQSFPELDDEAFEEMYLRFWRASVLGYRSLTLGLPEREGWDEILGCFEVERSRRTNTDEHREMVERAKAAKRVPRMSQEEWDAFRKRWCEESRMQRKKARARHRAQRDSSQARA